MPYTFFIDCIFKITLCAVLRLFRFPRRILRDQLHDFIGIGCTCNIILLSDKSTQNGTPVTMRVQY